MKALSGIKILDLSRILAGPFCTQLLGDLGADIIKIEQPVTGDASRGWGPPYAEGESAYYLSLNRNKRSVTLDLRSQEGLKIAHRLARESDVVIQNFKYGEAEKWGLGYEDLSAENPRLVYCTVSGYGPEGPYKERPGFDFMMQAQTGIMAITGPTDGPPSRVGVAVVDVTTGLYAANAILAALFARNQHPEGKGQKVEVSLYECALAWLSNIGQNHLISGKEPARFGNAHPTVVPYQLFTCSDGIAVAIAIGTDPQFWRFCKLVGRPEMAEDPRYKRNRGRVENRPELIELMNEIFLTRPSTEWVNLLMDNDIPAGEINNITRAFNNPQTDALGIVQEVEHPTIQHLKVVASPMHFSETPTTIERHPPLLGEHTAEVLGELGYTPEQQQELRSKGVI